MSDHWILTGKTPVRCDLMTWAHWLETHNAERIVARTRIGDVVVSTVFLGHDHGFSLDGSHPPVLFETMIFRDDDGSFYDEQQRYCTWAEAEAGHAEIVNRLKGAARDAKAMIAQQGEAIKALQQSTETLQMSHDDLGRGLVRKVTSEVTNTDKDL